MRLEIRTGQHAKERGADAHVGGHELSGTSWQIECERVARFYGAVPALREASFRADAGALLALFGANGAGKSTLLRILAGALKPTRGSVKVGGAPVGTVAARRQTGLLGHQSLLHPGLTVEENLHFFAKLYALAEPAAAVAAALQTVKGEHLARRRAGELSQGMRQKAALARCLLHRPRLLLLDEPFAGLDVQAVEEMRACFAGLRDRGLTLVVTSHGEHLIRDLATGVFYIENGRLKVENAPAEAARHV